MYGVPNMKTDKVDVVQRRAVLSVAVDDRTIQPDDRKVVLPRGWYTCRFDRL